MDIIFSTVFLIFSAYCYVLAGKESTEATPTELGGAFWPRIILVLLMVLLIVNIIKGLKNRKNNTNSGDKIKLPPKKLIIGMVIVALMAILMPYIGFIPVCFLFLAAYGILLGEKRPLRLFIMSLVITVILYALFQGALDIMLARGIGVFRSFALLCEKWLPF